MKLPVSAMVVGLNEAHFLDSCLASLFFCDEIIYTDLGSTDGSNEIAERFASLVFTRPIAPSGEYIQSEIVQFTKHDWVIFIDPDEVVDQELANEIVCQFNTLASSNEIGAVLVPWKFYFKKKKLKGTVWGGTNKKYLLVNKKRFDFLPITHYGRKIKEGYQTIEIALNTKGTNILHHYWVLSYNQFFKKHQRYLKKEGRDNYNQGRRIISFNQLLFLPFREFRKCYFHMKGYEDGITGLLLSMFWAYYQIYIAVDLLNIQRKEHYIKKQNEKFN